MTYVLYTITGSNSSYMYIQGCLKPMKSRTLLVSPSKKKHRHITGTCIMHTGLLETNIKWTSPKRVCFRCRCGMYKYITGLSYPVGHNQFAWMTCNYSTSLHVFPWLLILIIIFLVLRSDRVNFQTMVTFII